MRRAVQIAFLTVVLGWPIWYNMRTCGSVFWCGFAQITQPAAAGFIQTLSAPVAANFTAQNFNTGTGVVTTQANNSVPVVSISLKQHDPSATSNIAALDKAKLAATFTITEAFGLTEQTNQTIAGLWLSDGGSPPNNICVGLQNGVGYAGQLSTSFTTFSATVFSATLGVVGPLLWLRVQETASARIYSASSDGITFIQSFTESNTAHFTTSRYGLCVTPRSATATAPDGMITWYSFVESNP